MCRVCFHFQWKWFLLPCTFVCWLDLTLIIQSKRKLQTEMINSPDDDEGSERRQRRDKSERCLQLQARSPAENIQRSNANQKTVASHQYLSPSEMEKKKKKKKEVMRQKHKYRLGGNLLRGLEMSWSWMKDAGDALHLHIWLIFFQEFVELAFHVWHSLSKTWNAPYNICSDISCCKIRWETKGVVISWETPVQSPTVNWS